MCIKKDRSRSLYGLGCVSAVICFSVTVVNLMLPDNCLWKLVPFQFLHLKHCKCREVVAFGKHFSQGLM